MVVTVDLVVIGSVLGFILSVAAVIKLVYGPIKKMQEKNEAITNGLKVILHYRLMKESYRIQVQKGKTPLQEHDLSEIGAAYFALGGNGSGRAAYDAAMKYPTRSQIDKKVFADEE